MMVIASADGMVIRTRSSEPEVYGDTVILQHSEPIVTADANRPGWTLYAHLKRTFVDLGQRVSRGERLGEVGLFPASGGVPMCTGNYAKTGVACMVLPKIR